MGNREIFDAMASRYDTEERIRNASVSSDEIKKHLDYNSKDRLGLIMAAEPD